MDKFLQIDKAVVNENNDDYHAYIAKRKLLQASKTTQNMMETRISQLETRVKELERIVLAINIS
jgi:DNA repair ATPase RecN